MFSASLKAAIRCAGSFPGLIFIALTLPSVFGVTPGARAATESTLEFKPCELENPAGDYRTRAECADLMLPENPASADSTLIPVHIARITSANPRKKSDPLLFIAGGPGQAASESWSTVQGAFHAVAKNRDIYLIDQRGTGLSNKLTCPAAEEQSDVLVFNAEDTAKVSQECLSQLSGDPRYYTTSIAVDDLEKARQALGVDKWNIYGVSYGTRVALHYLRQHPAQVRTMTLDAAVPPGVALGPGIALDAEAALQQMLQRCTNDTACEAAYPDLESGTRGLLAALKKTPREIRYENFSSGTLETVRVNHNHLSLTMRMMSYSSHGVSILPNMLFEAYARDNFAPFARQAEMQSSNLGNSLASGMHNAVICTEDFPLVASSGIDREELEKTYLGATPIDALNANCGAWPAGVLDANFHTPVESEKPVLILSGGADPVTPPRYGEIVADHMPNALHIVNPFQGHMQIALGCTPSIVSNFISRGNTQDIDYGCLERLRPEPFFVNANGPRP